MEKVIDATSFRRAGARYATGVAVAGVVVMNLHRNVSLAGNEVVGSAVMLASAALFAASRSSASRCWRATSASFAALAARRYLPILHLAGKAFICRRPVNSAMVIKSKEVACTLRYQWKTLWTMIWLSADDHSFAR
jgi:hypothetical protein